MNYKFDNLNDKIPRGREIHSKLENYLPRTNSERLQHHALIRRVTHSCYVIRIHAARSRPHDAEIIDNKLKPRQKKRHRMERSKSRKYDLLDHFTQYFLFFDSPFCANKKANQLYLLCDKNIYATIKPLLASNLIYL